MAHTKTDSLGKPAAMAAPCPLLSDGITDDTLLNIARFLPTAIDLLCLKLTNSRFAAKIITASGAEGAAAAPEMLCIADEAGRLWLVGCSEQERGWVPRCDLESWLCLMHEVELLRVPVAFGRAHAFLTQSEGGAVVTRTVGGATRTAASTVVMRSGSHFVQFTVVDGFMLFGAIRPGWDVEGGEYAVCYAEDGHCFYRTFDGRREPGWQTWEGMQPAKQQGDRIGMLLDLDQGSMTVWKNDVKLGVMVAEGLSGSFCWAVEMASFGTSARIESAPLPADAGGCLI